MNDTTRPAKEKAVAALADNLSSPSPPPTAPDVTMSSPSTARQRRIRKPTNRFIPNDDDYEKLLSSSSTNETKKKKRNNFVSLKAQEKQIYEKASHKEKLLKVGDIVYAEYHGNRK